MVAHTSEEIAQTMGNLEDKKKIKTRRKKNKFSFPLKIVLHSLKHHFLNCTAWSIIVLISKVAG